MRGAVMSTRPSPRISAHVNATVLVLTGPTAVGKTELSLSVAEAVGAEIVSCDSRQVYRELTIGTAKPNPEVLARVPHHFIDERSIADAYSAGQFGEDACERIQNLHAEETPVIVVGGSTLYLEALVHGLAEVPRGPAALRKELTQQATTDEGREALFQELTEADPVAAKTFDATKTQRLVRFVEVLRHTGRPISSFWEETSPPPFSTVVIVLDRPRKELYERINARVDDMLDAGLLEENEQILSKGLGLTNPILKTIGYREPQQFLRGKIDRDEMVRLLKRNTRRYAKRQLTWFRRWEDYRWLDIHTTITEEIVSIWKGSPLSA